ncbi:sex comb on midleg 2, partial [Paramuricea clavata]
KSQLETEVKPQCTNTTLIIIVSDVGSTSSPLTWSIDEVVEYFKKSDISKYAELFRQHEIDGGALLLLNRETIMSCMQFKLGPALKLLNHISELKTKFSL